MEKYVKAWTAFTLWWLEAEELNTAWDKENMNTKMLDMINIFLFC